MPRSTRKGRGARMATVALLLACGCARESRPPDVVVYVVDTLRADHTSVYGYGRRTTPVLERLAHEAVVFDRALAQASWTKASIGSLFTGRYPSRHGAVRRAHCLDPEVPTLAEAFRRAGYATAAFVSNPNLLPVFGFDRGFDDFVDVESVERSATAERVHAAVFDFLARRPDKPLFLYVHTRDPHAPYAAPEAWRRRFPPLAAGYPAARVAAYDAEVAYADAELGRFVDALPRLGLRDPLLVFTSDHGEEFFEHGGVEHGRTLYGEVVHVPLLVRWRGVIRGGRRVSRPVRLMDLFATLLELAEIPVPQGSDARSFAALVEDPAAGRHPDRYQPVLFAEQNLDGDRLASVQAGAHKLIVRELPPEHRGVQLFDLRADPDEQVDVAAEQPGRVRVLAGELERVRSAFEDGVFIAFVNGVGNDARARVSGRVEVRGGTFAAAEGVELEAGDRLQRDPDGRALEFDLTLSNRPSPIGQAPAVLRDVDRIRVEVEASDARLRVSLDEPGGSELRLGGGVPLKSVEWPVEFAVDASSLGLASPAVGPEDTDAAQQVWLYRMRAVARHTVEIDAQLDARLRALGYLESSASPDAEAPDPAGSGSGS